MKKETKRITIKFLLPAMIFFVLIFVYPLLRTVVMSFFSVQNMTGPVNAWLPVGIGNYLKLFTTPIFLKVLGNLLKIWLFGGLVVLSIALLFAVILNSGIKGKRFFQSVIYLPGTISTVALALMWIEYAYNARFGLFARFFRLVGLEHLAGIEWMGPDHRFLAMFIAYCFASVGYHMIVFSSGIETIPADYYDAAKIDGCNRIKEFFYMTWPMIRGVLKTNITMWTISCAGFYTWSMMFTNGGKVDAKTSTPVSYLYMKLWGGDISIMERDAGLSAAAGVVTGIFVLVGFLLISVCIKDDDLEL